MRAIELLRKKRDGEELTAEDIRFMIDGYVAGRIPDYQMSAFLMAIYFQGMTSDETIALTQAMIDSGDTLALDTVSGTIVDKHSTGGVGDKTTLVLVPLIASAGVPVVKMSGRGLGHAGGTLDKFDSIPNFRTELTLDEALAVIDKTGACIIGQTGNLTPADKMLYALRDVTATVESIPLIAASVMSKKLAAGADALVLDVKYGRGAYMQDVEDALRLAHAMVDIARGAGKSATALVTSMEQPLGHAVGNALEIKEAIKTLSGEGPPDLVEVVLALGVEMLLLSGQMGDPEEARGKLNRLLNDGRALDKFRELVTAQGGDPRAIDDMTLLPQAPVIHQIVTDRSGIVQSIDTFEIGTIAMSLGAGRAVHDAPIDGSVGIELTAKIGDRIAAKIPIGLVHAPTEEAAQRAVERVLRAVDIGSEIPSSPPLIHSRIVSS